MILLPCYHTHHWMSWWCPNQIVLCAPCAVLFVFKKFEVTSLTVLGCNFQPIRVHEVPFVGNLGSTWNDTSVALLADVASLPPPPSKVHSVFETHGSPRSLHLQWLLLVKLCHFVDRLVWLQWYSVVWWLCSRTCSCFLKIFFVAVSVA